MDGTERPALSPGGAAGSEVYPVGQQNNRRAEASATRQIWIK